MQAYLKEAVEICSSGSHIFKRAETFPLDKVLGCLKGSKFKLKDNIKLPS